MDSLKATDNLSEKADLHMFLCVFVHDNNVICINARAS